MRYVALLRGINLAGHRKVAMADLRRLLADLGYDDVVTYLQSGNALFSTDKTDTAALEAEIAERLSGDLGMEIDVMIRSRDELAAVVDDNPFPAAADEPTKVHVAFLSGPLTADGRAALTPERTAPDEVRVGDRALYIWYPNGAGRSKLATALSTARLGVSATSRNWKTVTKLLALAGTDG